MISPRRRGPEPAGAPVPPVLVLLARFVVELGPVQDLGVTPWGHRRIVPITGGTFDGEQLRGTVQPGGADWQVIHPDGSTTIDTRYGLRTDGGAEIQIRTWGKRHGPPDVLAALAAVRDVDRPPTTSASAHASRPRPSPTTGSTGPLSSARAAREASAVRFDAWCVE